VASHVIVRCPGKLALEICNKRLELQVCRSNAGYYLGTYGEDGPCSRESLEYFSTEEKAQKALDSGEWTQRDQP